MLLGRAEDLEPPGAAGSGSLQGQLKDAQCLIRTGVRNAQQCKAWLEMNQTRSSLGQEQDLCMAGLCLREWQSWGSCDLLPAEPGMSQPVFVTIVTFPALRLPGGVCTHPRSVLCTRSRSRCRIRAGWPREWEGAEQRHRELQCRQGRERAPGARMGVQGWIGPGGAQRARGEPEPP